jgi:hypothetical protein
VIGLASISFRGNARSTTYVFWSSYHGAGLFSLSDFDDVASAPACLYDAHSTVVSTVWHAFVYAGVDSYRDFVSWVVGSEETAETDFPSLSRFLSEESSSP